MKKMNGKDTKYRIKWYVGSLVATLVVVRAFLHLSPHVNFTIKGYMVHHAFTGGLLLILATFFFVMQKMNNYTLALAGIGSALILDEIVYLTVTDGSDLAYLTPVSFAGMIITTIVMLALLGGIYYGVKKIK